METTGSKSFGISEDSSGLASAVSATRWFVRLWAEPAWWVLLAVFLVLTLPLVLSVGKGYEHDEANYHLPAIRQIAARWPVLKLQEDSLSAIAPGYHWFLAGVAQVTGTRLHTLRFINLGMSIMALAVLFAWLQSWQIAPWDCALLVAPLAFSNFFVKSASWILTDNAGLLMVTLSLITTMSPRYGSTVGVGAGILAGLTTTVRQLHVWLAGPLVLRGALWLRRSGSSEKAVRFRLLGLLPILFGGGIPAVVLAMLFLTWGGLVPARWAEASYGWSTCSIAYMLAVFAIVGGCYSFLVFEREERFFLCRRDWLLALGVGVLLAVASPTTFDHVAGRWGGYFWAVVARMPAVGERSLFFLTLAPLGMVVIFTLWRKIQAAGRTAEAHVWLCALAGWGATFLVNRQVFHRYFEPMILVFACLALGLAGVSRLTRWPRLVLALLAVLQVFITFATAHRKTFEG